MSSQAFELFPRQLPVPPPPTAEDIAFDNAPRILAITGTFFTAALIVVMLRIYVRTVLLRVIGIDDYVMLGAMVLCVGTFACFKIRTDYGLGHHLLVMFMHIQDFAKFALVQYIQSILIMLGISCIKISIAFTLLRLSPALTSAYKTIIFGALVCIALMTISSAFTLILQCVPVQAAWDYSLRPPPFGNGNARCLSTELFRNLGLMNSIFNIVTDVLFAALPIPLILKLQLSTRSKLSLIAIFSLGWFACIAAIIKCVQQWQIPDNPDFSVDDSFNVWNFIEMTIGIIAASLPTLKPLCKQILGLCTAVTMMYRSYTTRESENTLAIRNCTEEYNLEWIRGQELSSKFDIRHHSYPELDANMDAWGTQNRDSSGAEPPLQSPASNQMLITKEIRIQ